MMIGQAGFTVMFWFLYIYAVGSVVFLTVNIFRRGFIKLKKKDDDVTKSQNDKSEGGEKDGGKSDS